MISEIKNIPRKRWIRFFQLMALVLSLLVVLSFLRHSLTTAASSFRRDFERQTFIEMGRGETFLVARKLAALAKGEQIACITATKRGIVFFEEKNGPCDPGFFRVREAVVEPNQEITVVFTLRLQSELFYGFLAFLFVQIGLAALTFFTQRESLLLEHRHDLDLAALARQVGHDIRSPLAVLSLAQRQDGAVDLEVPERALRRLRELVGHLLGEKGAESRQKLGELVSEVVEEKRAEFGEAIQIECEMPKYLAERMAPGDGFVWKRLLSNLLNNSVEASAPGKAVVRLRARMGAAGAWSLEIEDRGRGIPAEILSKVGRRGFSHGKGRISGLGLAHAREFVEQLEGHLEINSREGEGTSVRLLMPALRPHAAVLIDDDAALGRLWAKVAEKRGVFFRHYSSPEAFLREAGQISQESVVYLDVEIPGTAYEPLAFGESLSEVGFRVFLATGHAANRFRGLYWVAGVVGKEPPWME